MNKNITTVTKRKPVTFTAVLFHIVWNAALPVMLLLCSCMEWYSVPDMPGNWAVIYKQGGKNVASGVLVEMYRVASSDSHPVSVYLTDERGRFSIADLPPGLYNLRARKDTMVVFQDSIVVTETQTTLGSDTLENPSTLAGIVSIKPEHDSRTVSIRLPGTGLSFNVIDISGAFTLGGLAGGTYLLELTSTFPDYSPTFTTVSVGAGSDDTLDDTLYLDVAGIPVVSGTAITQDTASGVLHITWKKTLHKDFLDYLLYRKDCDAKDYAFNPVLATSDTFFTDSHFVNLPADLADSAERCLRYWIAVRSNSTRTGPVYHYTAWRYAPKSFIMTALTCKAREVRTGSDSASVNDTLTVSVTAKNRTRPVRSIIVYDPATEDTIRTITNPDSSATVLTDTLRYMFDSIGVHRLIAVATDDAGVQDTTTVSVPVVPDIPVADAGPDTGVFTGQKAFLHGNAYQRFGGITEWKWKIGNSEWTETSGPDTVVTVPETEQTVVCSLSATDEDGNTSLDAMQFYTAFKVTAIAAGAMHNLILKEDGSAWTCGNNDFGQLGIGVRYSGERKPGRVMTDVNRVAAGGAHSFFLKKDGSLWTCGDNQFGQLGDGTTIVSTTPVKIMDDVTNMTGGEQHSLIIKTDKTLWSCGANDSGQLGDGTNDGRLIPVKVMNNVKMAAAGWYHSFMLKTDGTLWACGDNNSGKLGDETIEDKNTPFQMMSDVMMTDAAERHSLFVKTDGALLACGNNWYGQLGDSTGGRWVKPTETFNDVKSVAAGKEFTLILTDDGTLLSCGLNEYGQLGDGSTKNRYKPVKIMTEVKAMAAGNFHTLILKTDGSLWVCGDDTEGQLCGVPLTHDSSRRPVRAIPFQQPVEEED